MALLAAPSYRTNVIFAACESNLMEHSCLKGTGHFDRSSGCESCRYGFMASKTGGGRLSSCTKGFHLCYCQQNWLRRPSFLKPCKTQGVLSYDWRTDDKACVQDCPVACKLVQYIIWEYLTDFFERRIKSHL
ncbi:uncharacterized protein LOC144115527 isoform X3 [Amblyomma americanum]